MCWAVHTAAAGIAQDRRIQCRAPLLWMTAVCVDTEKLKLQRIQRQCASAQAILRRRVDHHRDIHIIKDLRRCHRHLAAEVFLGRRTDHTHFAAQFIDHFL